MPEAVAHPFLEFFPAVSRRKVAGQLLTFLGWLAVTVIGITLTPAREGHGTHQQLGFPPCPSVLLFNRPCPGCGLTTSFTRLLHGDVIGAFQAHALGPILYLLFAGVAFVSLAGFVKQKRWNVHTWKFQVLLVSFTVSLLVYGIARFATSPNYQTHKEQTIASYMKAKHE